MVITNSWIEEILRPYSWWHELILAMGDGLVAPGYFTGSSKTFGFGIIFSSLEVLRDINVLSKRFQRYKAYLSRPKHHNIYFKNSSNLKQRDAMLEIRNKTKTNKRHITNSDQTTQKNKVTTINV